MSTREQMDMESAAIAVEVSRQIAHDFSNFVYNLLLQVEIWENSQKPNPADWQHLKREGKRMAILLQQWELFQNRFLAAEPSGVDLHDLIRQVASAASPDDSTIKLTPAITSEALVLQDGSTEIKHLLHLLLEEALLACEESERTDPRVSIQTERTNGKAVVRFLTAGQADGNTGRSEDCTPASSDAEEPSLVEATCQSLALRLDGTIHRERDGKDRCIVSVEFPLSPSM